jgi:CopG family nickel-responsive transcriptional regulator
MAATMKNDADLARITISLPEELLDDLERRILSKGYASRSEFVRDLIREQLVDEAWEESAEPVIGVLTISYDHHQRGLSQKLVDAQHSHHTAVLCSTHVHLDHHLCLETIILKGPAEEIVRISREIGGIKGVRLARLTRTSALDL